MVFEQILLQILYQFKQERTISAPYHLLRGKRSGQTIQDVGIYHLHNYFGLLPKLDRKIYNETLSRLTSSNYLTIDEDGKYDLTTFTLNKLEHFRKIPFDGWHFRGNEHLFFARLSLVVQALSYKYAGQMSFIPIQKDEQVQQWVREFLVHHDYQKAPLQSMLLKEIIQSLEKINLPNKEKEIVINRLSGHELAGLTWQQISVQAEMAEMDIQLLYISCLHSWLNEIILNERLYPILHQLTRDIKIKIPLSGSAFQTAELFYKGCSIKEISEIRRLKESTIEDHIVELAMNEPQLPIEQFITKEDMEKILTVVNDYQTRKLKILHEILPHLSYFQIRLVLARGEK